MIYKTLHRKQDWSTRTPLKTVGEIRYTGRVSIYVDYFFYFFRNNWLVATKYLWKFYSFVEMPIFSQNIWGNMIGMWNTRSYIACCLYISIKLFAYIFTWCLIVPVYTFQASCFPHFNLRSDIACFTSVKQVVFLHFNLRSNIACFTSVKQVVFLHFNMRSDIACFTSVKQVVFLHFYLTSYMVCVQVSNKLFSYILTKCL